MMHAFLAHHRAELIERCEAKAAVRLQRMAGGNRSASGIPMFLDQLMRTLRAEEAGDVALAERISGSSMGDGPVPSEIGMTAASHGASLLDFGHAVDEVVHDYGDLCQAITDLAFERDAPFAVTEFRTLNRCLDNAIAGAVLEFSARRHTQTIARRNDEMRERVGFLVHELRNALSTADLALAALDAGAMSMGGATGAVLKRSLATLGMLVNRAMSEVRQGSTGERQVFSVASFIADAQSAATLGAAALGIVLDVPAVDATLATRGDRGLLLAALANLLQNAVKFTHARSTILLEVTTADGQVRISVHDHCGGLPAGSMDKMFTPFNQHDKDRSGLGLGLAIARSSVEADFGTLSVRDVPGTGCVFTMTLPQLSIA